MACIPGEACWIRAGEPLLLHWLPDGPRQDGVGRALCGAESRAWRCVDDDGITATECRSCSERGPALRTATEAQEAG